MRGLWRHLCGSLLVADRAFDPDQLRAVLAAHRIFTCIPVKTGRRRTYHFNPQLHAHRDAVENTRLKRSRRLGTRYEKLAETFLGFVLPAACLD